MDAKRKMVLATHIRQQIEDALEGAKIDARICNGVSDQKGLDEAKKRIKDMEERLAQADKVIADYKEEEESVNVD